MILYHASDVEVRLPDIIHSRDNIDFGRGFYLTNIHEQAVNYAGRFKRRNKLAWINTYEFVYNPSQWKVRVFDSYDGEWLRFVSECRAGEDKTDYDLVVGGIANDKVIRTLDLYFRGLIDENQALGLLMYEKPNMQYCIRSQSMLDKCLIHKESKML